MLTFERKVAWRYLWARRQEGVVSIIAAFSFLGITLGVATLIIVMSVMNGFRQELLSRILGMNGHLRIYEIEAKPIPYYQDLQKHILTIKGVEQAHPLIERQAMATVPGGAAAVVIHGIDISHLQQRQVFKESVTLGNLPQSLKEDEIIIGKRLAEKMGLTLNKRLSLVVPEGMPTVFGTVPRTKTFVVRGIFDIGMIEYDSAFVFISLESAQSFFRLPNKVTNIEIFTHSFLGVGEVATRLAKELSPSLRVLDWQKANQGYFEAIQVERNVMFIILTLIIIVAAFNIISSLIMLVKDKTTDIAVLRTLGASPGMIMRIFLLVGSSIGMSGALFGSVLGIAFAANIEKIRRAIEALTHSNLFQAEIYFLTKLPAIMDTKEVLLVVVMAFLLSLGATFYPAWRASKLDPAEALRQA